MSVYASRRGTVHPRRSAAPAGPSFFGQYTMLREFWAEDPDWTAPADGADLVTIRDNGTRASDLTPVGTITPKYRAAGGINGKPCFEFNATSPSDGGGMRTTSGIDGGGFSLVVVGKFNITGVSHYLTDSWSSNRLIIGALAAGDWRLYHSSGLFLAAGTPDTASHLFVGTILDDNMRLYVDDTLVGSDLSGSVGNVTGFALGTNNVGDNQFLDGDIAYAALYSGDITSQAGYASWVTDIRTYYGV